MDKPAGTPAPKLPEGQGAMGGTDLLREVRLAVFDRLAT